jgi:parallel beta-helix repeat protein
VQSTNVLIDKCSVSGTSDSGIYVGQSQHVVVRNNTVFDNVAGIEIDNTQQGHSLGNHQLRAGANALHGCALL